MKVNTHQLLNPVILQPHNIILSHPIRQHERVRLDRARAVSLLGAAAAREPVKRARVVVARVDGQAQPVGAVDIALELCEAAAAARVALDVEVPVGRDAAVGDRLRVAGAAEVGVDVAADGGGAGAVARVVEVDVDGRGRGGEAEEDGGEVHVGLAGDGWEG